MVELVLISYLSQICVIDLMDLCYVITFMHPTGLSACKCITSKINFWLAVRMWWTQGINFFVFAKICPYKYFHASSSPLPMPGIFFVCVCVRVYVCQMAKE